MSTSANPIDALIDAYLTHLQVERRLADHTLESYGRDLQRLAAFAAGLERPVQRLDRHDLEAFVADMMGEGLSPRSVARTVAAVRGFYRFSTLTKRLESNPADDLHAPRAWPALPKFLGLEEVEKLIKQPDVATPIGLRDRALIGLMVYTFARVSAAVGMPTDRVRIVEMVLQNRLQGLNSNRPTLLG